MCEEVDLEGVRRWFYGGTPPLDANDGPADAPAAADTPRAPADARPSFGQSATPGRQLEHSRA